MRSSAWMPAFAVIVTIAGLASGQPPSPRESADPAADTSSASLIDAPVICIEEDPRACERWWAGCDYLLWWIKPQPIAAPIVAVNDLGNAPILGAPGTRILFGNQDQNMGSFSGVRPVLGCWLGADQTIGIEATGFWLGQQSQSFNFASSGATPAAAFPVISPVTGVPFTVPINGPAGGSIIITSESRLWGAEVNGILAGFGSGPWEVELLGGFRHVSLHERFDLANPFRFAPGAGDDAFDLFECTNRFYGGQLGTRVGLRRNRLSADLSAKVALGSNHQEVNILGSDTSVVGGVPTVTTPGGPFTSTSNIGRTTRDPFAVIPEVAFKAGFAVTNYLRATVGYDFLYWNQVVRPGSQIDSRVLPIGNPTGIPALFNRTDFWVHGVSFGIELSY